MIVNISDPAQPSLVGKSPVLPDVVKAVALEGNFAYIANPTGGLRIINVSNPANPVTAGFVASPAMPFSEAGDIAVEDDYAYLTSGESGLRIIDIRQPDAPVEVGFFATRVRLPA